MTTSLQREAVEVQCTEHRVLVCGSRDFIDAQFLNSTLDDLHATCPITHIIEGEAKGADTLARLWGWSRQVPVLRFPAHWDLYGRGAGPLRNKQMLNEGQPHLVVAFSYNIAASRGTANMMKQAKAAGVSVQFYGR